MNRRDSIRKLMVASGSLAVLPAWARGWEKSGLTASASGLMPAAQETLAAIVDTFIPAGNSIGALSVGVDKFLLKLLEDCYEADVQELVKGKLKDLEETAHTAYGQPFGTCNQRQREAMLQELSLSAHSHDVDFYKLIKSETIRGFTTSREVMVNHLHYRQVPGHYHGCVDIPA